MFVLSVVFGNVSLGFMFRTREAAEKSLFPDTVLPENPLVTINDDFGSSAQIYKTSIHGWVLEDLDQSKVARAEQMVHHNRCQNLASKIATSDPSLRVMGSPAVVMPNMNGGFPR